MEKARWIIFSVVVILLFGSLIAWSRLANPPVDTSNVDKSGVVSASEASGNIEDHVRGDASSSVVVVEYADFQCPSCQAANSEVNDLVNKYGDSVAFIFRNFPLPSIHPNAQAASGAAEAAGLQNKYWEMQNLLFENQTSWSTLDTNKRTDAFRSYATQLGLDPEQFVGDLGGEDVRKKISFDVSLGTAQGVTGTPRYYVNGEPIDTEVASSFVNGDPSSFHALLDEYLAEE